MIDQFQMFQLIDWMDDVHGYANSKTDVILHSYHLLHKHTDVVRHSGEFQLYAAACLTIAAKLYENGNMLWNAEWLRYLCANQYTIAQINEMERRVLKIKTVSDFVSDLFLD